VALVFLNLLLVALVLVVLEVCLTLTLILTLAIIQQAFLTLEQMLMMKH
jgi:hypothetical protein